MEYKQVIIVRTDLKMDKGKIAAQVGHACIEAFLKTQKKEPNWVEEWLSQGQTKVVLKIESEKELVMLFEDVKKRFPVALIKDAGKTQITPGSITCIGIGPIPEIEVDKFTNKLKLL